MSDLDALKDYTKFDFDNGRWTRPVYRRGAGPAVIVIHEMPGLHPAGAALRQSRRGRAGMTVFLPSLFGEPGKPVTAAVRLGEMLKGICIRREFDVWAPRPVQPDRRLAAGAGAERRMPSAAAGASARSACASPAISRWR